MIQTTRSSDRPAKTIAKLRILRDLIEQKPVLAEPKKTKSPPTKVPHTKTVQVKKASPSTGRPSARQNRKRAVQGEQESATLKLPKTEGSEQPSTSIADASEEAHTPRPAADYAKFDKLPDEWVEDDWTTRPRNAEGLPWFHVPVVIWYEANEEGDIVKTKKEMESKRRQGEREWAFSRKLEAETKRVGSSNEYTQLAYIIQDLIHTLNCFDTKKFEGFTAEVDQVVETIQVEAKPKSLHLHDVLFDTYLYAIYSSMKPNNECFEEGIYIRKFFLMLQKSIEKCYKECRYSTKTDMLDIVENNIFNLRLYGDKMVLPCSSIIEHLGKFVEQVLKMSRER